MYGDFAPIESIIELLNNYDKLHLYADDAHGMSWYGKHGKGYILNKIHNHKKVVTATSFAKAYGVGGGVFVFPNQELYQKVKNCGGPFIFSGPHQIPVLGAAIASAKIHLTDEIYELQKKLSDRIAYCHSLLKFYNLPVISSPKTPIFFIGLGLLRVGFNMVKRMMKEGFYLNIGMFPAVPEICTGVRFTITLHHRFQDIENLVKALAYHFAQALIDEERSIHDVYRSFKKVATFSEGKSFRIPQVSKEDHNNQYKVQHERTINSISQNVWDGLCTESSFDWKALQFLEDVFTNNDELHNNWEFHYYIIKDKNDIPVLATYFTVALQKDDMLTAKSISQKIESERKKDPYYLTSITMMMGCALSLGSHIYIDRSRPDWKKVMMLLIDMVWKEQENMNANFINFRDFDPEDKEMCDFLMDQGFLQIKLPATHILKDLSWQSEGEYLRRFSGKRRYNLKQEVFKHEQKFSIKIIHEKEKADVPKYYELYNNVVEKSFEVSSFKLPYKLFEKLLEYQQWEIIELRLNDKHGNGEIIGVDFCYKTKKSYEFLFVGINYNYLESHNVYKQAMWQAISRSNILKSQQVNLGVTASTSKRKFGANLFEKVAFIQMKDNFNMNLIEVMSNTKISVKQ